MNDLQVTRTPEMVAAEINLIKDQTRKLVLSNSILIGTLKVIGMNKIKVAVLVYAFKNSVRLLKANGIPANVGNL